MSSWKPDPKYQERTEYNKLVRDGIPAHIQEQGKPFAYHTATNQEYRQALWAKLDEEIAELHEEQTAAELADVLEILYAVARELKLSPQQIEDARKQRLEQRGGYNDRIILEWS